MKTTENGKKEFIKYLRDKAEGFELQADEEASKFNQGYFEGKAEALYQVADSIFDETGELDEGV
jgi:hypothetical protein